MKVITLGDNTQIFIVQARTLKITGCDWLLHITKLKTKDKVMKKKFKGFSYAPRDNSYAINLSLRNETSYLAGTWDTLGQKVAIIKEPFRMPVKTGLGGKPIEMDMVLVQCDKGHVHSVMFDERWVNTEVKPLNEKRNPWF